MSVLLSDLTLHTDEASGTVAEMVEIVTARGYRIALAAEALFHLVRDPSGAPIVGNVPPIAVTIDSHAGSADFKTGLLTGLVVTLGRSVARASVAAHLHLPVGMTALRDLIVSELQSDTTDTRRRDGIAFQIYSGPFEGDDRLWEIVSRYLSLRVNAFLDETGNRLNQAALIGASWSTQVGFLTGLAVGASVHGTLPFRHAPDAVFLQRYLVECLGTFSTVELPKAEQELYPRRPGQVRRQPTLTIEPGAIERLRRGSTFLASLISPAGDFPDPEVLADPIVEAYACECPAYAVDLAEGPAKACGFTFAHSDLDEAAKASAIEFARSVSTLIG